MPFGREPDPCLGLIWITNLKWNDVTSKRPRCLAYWISRLRLAGVENSGAWTLGSCGCAATLRIVSIHVNPRGDLSPCLEMLAREKAKVASERSASLSGKVSTHVGESSALRDVLRCIVRRSRRRSLNSEDESRKLSRVREADPSRLWIAARRRKKHAHDQNYRKNYRFHAILLRSR